MTDIDITEATRLAAEAVDAATLALTPHGYVLAIVERDDIATAAVAAALPALAEQFAALIVAAASGSASKQEQDFDNGLLTAARLVRSFVSDAHIPARPDSPDSRAPRREDPCPSTPTGTEHSTSQAASPPTGASSPKMSSPRRRSSSTSSTPDRSSVGAEISAPTDAAARLVREAAEVTG